MLTPGRITFAVLILLAGLPGEATAQNTQSEFWPEVDAYINLNPIARVLLLTHFKDGGMSDWRGDFGVHLDFALKPIFRRQLRSNDDVFRKRYLSFRAGFRYITNLGANSSPYVEHRWVVELTSRYPLPEKLLISDRSRGELRFISGQPFSTRYRNKLQLERDFSLGSLVFTPYLNGELFYDTRYDTWNRNRYSAGVQVPAGRHLVIETYVLRQNDSRSSSPHVNALGLAFNLYF
jgi:hypothetical protein